MTVDDRQSAFVVLRCHFSGRIGAEGAHLIIERRRMEDQLGFVKIFVQELHDFIPNFHTHSYIHRPRCRLYADLTTLLTKPVSAFSSDGGDDGIRIEGISLHRGDPHRPSVLRQDILHHRFKEKVHPAVFQMPLESAVDPVSFFGSQMANGALYQLQIGIDRRLPNLSDFILSVDAVNILIRPEIQIDFIRFMNQFPGFVIP